MYLIRCPSKLHAEGMLQWLDGFDFIRYDERQFVVSTTDLSISVEVAKLGGFIVDDRSSFFRDEHRRAWLKHKRV